MFSSLLKRKLTRIGRSNITLPNRLQMYANRTRLLSLDSGIRVSNTFSQLDADSLENETSLFPRKKQRTCDQNRG